jgi:hypothetical protein
MDTVSQFARLWNGSEPGWVVQRHVEDRVELIVLFSYEGPTTREVVALRRVAQDLATKSASEVLLSLKAARSYCLGTVESSRARKLRAECESLGLRLAARGRAITGYSIVNEQTAAYLLIEDAPTLQALAQEAIKRGLPVRESTA